MRTALTFRTSHLQAMADALDDGYLRIYSGTVPATADTAITDQTLLAELRLATPSEASITAGVLTLDVITDDSSADDSGTPTFARLLQSDGNTMVGQMSASGSGGGGELELTTASIVAAAVVSISSATITYPAA
jgi:hypothetical protein